MEPDFIAQCGEPMTPEERMSWLKKRANEANAKGATFHRASIHPEQPDLTLLESWKVAPEDQGKPRWQMVSHS